MPDSLEIIKRLAVIKDDGPLYNEFVHDAVVHEPWNAYSSLIFFVPIIFWLWRLKGEYKQHLIIIVLLPFLFLNGLGSTLFHAFRDNPFFLILDWLPAALMSLTLTSYFWTKVVKKWYLGLLIVVGIYGLGMLTVFAMRNSPTLFAFAPNVNYFFTGIALFLPILVLLYRMNYRLSKYVLLTILFLVLALICRTLDYPTANPFPIALPQGTHFMWHIFSSIAVFSLGFFIYRMNKEFPKEK